MALGSLEAAQTCVLLGTYYLFHGDPGLAWPVCGCTLRTAQALNLHRKQPPPALSGQSLLDWRVQNELGSIVGVLSTRLRLSAPCHTDILMPLMMVIGIEPLDPSAKSQSAVVQSPLSFHGPLQCEPSLLSYKYFMSKLSVIIKEALAELYRLGPVSVNHGISESRPSPCHLIDKVTLTDQKFQEWKAEIPASLQVDWTAPPARCYASPEELDNNVGATGPQLESHIFQLQGLTLHLAYDNARILVHRPLLSFRLKADSTGTTSEKTANNPFRRSMQIFVMQRSAHQDASQYQLFIADTYAAAFVGIHTFTAGLTLGILGSIDPLNAQYHELMLGLQRLMAIQRKLKDRSPLPAQGLEILQQLARHVMEKELSMMLGVSQYETAGSIITAHSTTRSSQPINEMPPEHHPLSGNDYAPQPAISTSSLHCLVHPTSTSYTQDSTFQYIPDMVLSQAVADFDKVISSQYPLKWSVIETSDDFQWLPTEDNLSVPEQTWILELDHFNSPQY